MKKNEKTVIGIFEERLDAVEELKRLQGLGYTQDQISVYTSPERSQTVARLMGLKVMDVDAEVTEQDEDISWWETIKNSFNFYTYDGDEGGNRIRSIDSPERTGGLPPEAEAAITGGASPEMQEYLKPYLAEIADNKLVIVVENYGQHDTRV